MQFHSASVGWIWFGRNKNVDPKAKHDVQPHSVQNCLGHAPSTPHNVDVCACVRPRHVGCDIADSGAQALADALLVNTTLKELVLYGS